MEPENDPSTTDPESECSADDLPDPTLSTGDLFETFPGAAARDADLVDAIEVLADSGLSDGGRISSDFVRTSSEAILEYDNDPSTTDRDPECCAEDLPEPDSFTRGRFEPFAEAEAALNTDLADAAELIADSGL